MKSKLASFFLELIQLLSEAGDGWDRAEFCGTREVAEIVHNHLELYGRAHEI